MRVWNFAVLAIGIWAACQAAFTAGMLHLEGRRDFCIACHLHEAKHARMLAPPTQVGELSAVHYAAGIGCAACHREPGPLGRVITLYTLGASDAAAYLFTDFAEPTALSTPLRNALCLECHGQTLRRPANPDSYHGTPPHNDRQDIHCTTCHVHHERGDPTWAYLRLADFEAGCASCHRELFPDVTPAQRLAPATGELSLMRGRLREKGVRID